MTGELEEEEEGEEEEGGGVWTKTKAHSKVGLRRFPYRLTQRKRRGLHPEDSNHPCQWTHHRHQRRPRRFTHLHILPKESEREREDLTYTC